MNETKSFNIITYNVLSQALANPAYYISCDPKYLDSNYRLELLKNKLQHEMIQEIPTIICLQEISRTWHAELIPFFEQNNYKFVVSSFGSEFGDYCACAIAYPNCLHAIRCKMIRIGSKIKKENENIKRNNSIFIRILAYFAFLVYLTFLLIQKCYKKKDKISNENPSYLANKKSNTMIYLELEDEITDVMKKEKDKTKRFAVATYHMPCAFKTPKVMELHAFRVLMEVTELSNGLPLVLAGDFNSTPTSSAYNILTNVADLKSAYDDHNGNPKITNHSRTSSDLIGFSDCIDYIFVSSKIEVTYCKYPTSYLPNWLPDKNEPSDHLMLGPVTIQI